MKNYWLWLIPVGLIVYFLAKNRQPPSAPLSPSQANTKTAAPPDPFWKGWLSRASASLTNEASVYGNALVNTPANPITSGSGAGVPTDAGSLYDSVFDWADPNAANWSFN